MTACEEVWGHVTIFATIEDLSKSFDGVRVLNLPKLSLPRAHVTAIVGANGSGKSTLVKILSGYHSTVDSGHMVVLGERLDLPIHRAGAQKINMQFIHQDLAIVGAMSVMDNICLAAGYSTARPSRISWTRTVREVEEALARVGAEFAPDTLCNDLGPGDLVLVAMARVLASRRRDTGILVLDEPTAATSAREADRILGVVRQRKEEGWSVIYIGHDLEEVLEIADSITVLRDGELAGSFPAAHVDVSRIAELMIGADGTRESSADSSAAGGHMGSPRRQEGASIPALQVKGLTGRLVKELDRVVPPGKSVGMSGLAGSGKSELARILAGASRFEQGQILIGGQYLGGGSVNESMALGVAYVPQERLRSAIIPQMNVAMNITGLTFEHCGYPAWISHVKETSHALQRMQRFGVAPLDAQRQVTKLSGGNQQKCVLVRATSSAMSLLVLDEPTSGVDVGARLQIHEHIRQIAASGVGVLLLSNDLDEMLSLSEVLYVMRNGRLLGRSDERTLNKRALLEWLHTSSAEVA